MPHKFIHLISCVFLVSVLLTVGCSAQTEEQALKALREMTRDGKLPAESVVADIESRFADKKTGALAKLLRARIRFESGDFAGAAAILNSDVFAKRTKLADHALWLRGQALNKAGDYAEAMNVLSELLHDHPESVRVRDAKLLWASSAIASGHTVDVPGFLVALSEKNDAEALLLTAKAYEAQGSQPEAINYYRRTYFNTAVSEAGKEAHAKLVLLGQPLTAQTAEEQLARADNLLAVRNFAEATAAYGNLAAAFPSAMTPQVQRRRLTAIAGAAQMADARAVFSSLPSASKEQEEGYRQLVLGYAKAKMWPQVRTTVDEMRQKFPNGALVPKTMIDAGLAAREAKNRTDEGYLLNTALAAYPNAVEVAQAQFEAAWFQPRTALHCRRWVDRTSHTLHRQGHDQSRSRL